MQTLANHLKDLLLEGVVIPAHPLALDASRNLDVQGQRALTRYYLEAGAGGIAIGVHTTQFAIRDPRINLYQKLLEITIEEILEERKPILKIAGVSGPTIQACQEAILAKDIGYDLVLLSNNGLQNWSEKVLLERAMEVAQILPVFGFYLQPAVGGKVLSKGFWQALCELENVHAIKIAPFNRYQTLDVIQAVCHSTRCEEIALYTGNDDNIILDLLTTYSVNTPKGIVNKNIVGGLLGHWAVWTKKAVAQLAMIKKIKESNSDLDPTVLTLAQEVTDSNAAFFDAKNNYAGCIAGIHEVLYRQGLLKGIWCLDPAETLSPGQQEEINRVYNDYPHLHDDNFVKKNLDRWLKN